MRAVAMYHFSRLRWVSLKIVPSVTENWRLQSRQTYRMRSGTAFVSSAPVLGFLRVRVPACLTYLETLALSQLTQRTPSGHRIDTRKSLQASGGANCLATSTRFICGLYMYYAVSLNCCQVDNHGWGRRGSVEGDVFRAGGAVRDRAAGAWPLQAPVQPAAEPMTRSRPAASADARKSRCPVRDRKC